MKKINVEQMNEKQLKKAIDKISLKIEKINNNACSKANKLLEAYGMQAKMQIVLQPKSKEE